MGILIGIAIVLVVGFSIMLAKGSSELKKEEWRLNTIKENGFNIDYFTHLTGGYSTLAADYNLKKLVWISNDGESKILDFDEVLDFSVSTDKETIIKRSKSGALVGAAVAGVGGALIGSALKSTSIDIINSIEVELTLKDIKEENIIFLFYDKSNGDSFEETEKAVNQWASIFKKITLEK